MSLHNNYYLFHAVYLHIGIGLHPAVTVGGHCGGPFLDGAVTAVAHKTHHRDDHRQHGPVAEENEDEKVN